METAMGKHATTRVVLSDGSKGAVETWQPDGGDGAHAMVRLDDGARLRVPADALQARADGEYFLPLGRAQLDGGPAVIPVVVEELSVGKRVIDTGVVRLRKVVHEREEVVDTPLLRETVHVERVPVNRFVEGPLGPREEGGVLIVPVLEEVLVVEKRLMLREELRITRRRDPMPSTPQRVTLRREEVVVERAGAAEPPGGSDAE